MRSWACWSENEVCLSALLECCYFEELKIDCTIDQLKPGLKSKVNGAICFCYLKSAVVENVPLCGSTMHVHFAYYTQEHTNVPNIKNERITM